MFRLFELICRARPVTRKSNPLINVIFKNEQCTCRSTKTSTDDVLRCLTGGVDELVGFGCISTGRSVYTLIRKSRLNAAYTLYSLAPCLCNAITLVASALTIHKLGAGRPLIDVSSKFMITNFHSISLRSKPGLLQ